MLELESKLIELEEHKEKEVVTMCPGGGLSLAAVDVMREAGFKDVKSLKGGTDAWNKKGYPTTRV
jgi:rhodanese-related sulfurtransferase